MAFNALLNTQDIQEPPISRFLFGSTKMALLWLPIRLWVGYEWFEAGMHKATDPKWTQTGEALKGFWVNASKIPEAPAKAAITFDWYRSFLQFLIDQQAYTWFAKLIAYGELLVGIGLVIGFLTGIAAFFGATMNFNFMMAGSASTNPLLFTAAIGLVLAWKVAGYYGADAVLLRNLGTPWQLGALFRREEAEPRETIRAAVPVAG
ncbi:MAG TPA: DoxX family membrane protein [Chloroflexota bacterium]|nr:DoxX family membrane protein [Chloroflexota bacterium]